MIFGRKTQSQGMQSAVELQRRMLSANSSFTMKEAYNSIRTKLMFTGRGEKCPVFAVTSALMHDGKTTNAVNLAISIAMTGKKVLLIDADMRKPTIHRFFGVENVNGLSEVLAGLTNEVQIRKTPTENLHVLTSGQVPPNPAELMDSKQMDSLLEYVKKYFDYVIIDTPPVNIVTDAATLAERVTGYVFIVQSGKNHYNDIDYAMETISQMNGTIAGLILNDTNGKSVSRYGYKNYHYSYHRYGYSRYNYYYSRLPEKKTQKNQKK